MPVIQEKPEKSMALLPQAEAATGSQLGNPQGEARQPTSLQGLLRFAMEATKAEDAPNATEFQPMDEEVGIQSETLFFYLYDTAYVIYLSGNHFRGGSFWKTL